MKVLLRTAALWMLVQARRQAVYSSNYTTGYFLTGDSLYSLELSGQQESSDSLKQELKQISPPAQDSGLVIDGQDILYAVSGTSCQTAIKLQMYNSTADSWSQLTSSPSDWFRPNSTSWYDSGSNSILIYGGLYCNGSISQSFFNYSIDASTWSEVTATTMPREMAYGQVISTSKDSVMIVGGQTNAGWLSMQQVAIWQYGGWSYFSVDNYTNIDSRDDPYLLPLWNNTESSVSSIVVIGGTVAGRNATPSIALMDFSSKDGWSWASTDLEDSGLMVSAYSGIYSSSSNEIYGSAGQTVKSVSPVALSSTSSLTEHKGLDSSGIAAVSTVVPLLALIAVAVCVWFWWRKRKQRRTFLPRQSQIITDNQSLDFDDSFANFSYPPMRQAEARLIDSSPRSHRQQSSHQEYEQNDVHFVSNRIHSNLRVVNPDCDASSLSSAGTLGSLGSGTRLLKEQDETASIASQSSYKTVDGFYQQHRATHSRDIASMVDYDYHTHSRSSSRSDLTRASHRSVSGASKFDFSQ